MAANGIRRRISFQGSSAGSIDPHPGVSGWSGPFYPASESVKLVRYDYAIGPAGEIRLNGIRLASQTETRYGRPDRHGFSEAIRRKRRTGCEEVSSKNGEGRTMCSLEVDANGLPGNVTKAQNRVVRTT